MTPKDWRQKGEKCLRGWALLMGVEGYVGYCGRQKTRLVGGDWLCEGA